ncbi:hypothetical protein MRB53_036042 [Persea americana]|uniref:Uncharacterized protein n=1 Tax=Persea americana TaxID=3435 RepID=A0ACC2K6B8_PERAE|nr:hypothetical protein MRB53_036042 [Persea americana]
MDPGWREWALHANGGYGERWVWGGSFEGDEEVGSGGERRDGWERWTSVMEEGRSQTKAVVQHLYLGRSPPMFAEARVIHESDDDDHLVMEMGMNFLAADDMKTILAVKLRKRLGFGIWAKMHITGMHIEGRVLVGVKFLRCWPFIGRLRVCFVESPYFQMTVKPIFRHGLDVTELPGIAGWLDKLLAVAFEQTLVEPNMLVVDVEKFVSKTTESPESWFTMDEKTPVAFAKVEIVEAADFKPSDLNGSADPYVKGQLGPYRFRTRTQKKTLAPMWQEEFKIPIHTWESPSVLLLEVCDEDHFLNDAVGNCSIDISNLRGGQRHDKWLPLENIKTGRLHLAVTVLEEDEKEWEHKLSNDKDDTKAGESDAAQQDSTQQDPEMADNFEPINIEGQQQTGTWVHLPGSNVSQTWEPRKREGRRPEIEIHKEDNGSCHGDTVSESEHPEGNRLHRLDTVRRSLKKMGSIFHRSPRSESPMTPNNRGENVPSPRINIRATGENRTNIKFVMDGEDSGAVRVVPDESLSPQKSEAGSPSKGHLREKTKNILKQAGRSAHTLKHVLSRKDSHKSKEVLESSLVTE